MRARLTRNDLRRDLAALGVEPGTTLTVHSSLSAIGWVEGGAPTVISALLEALGAAGTLVMPAATPQCAAAAEVVEAKGTPAPPEPPDDLPLFDRDATPTPLGVIPETFRTWPGTLRSDHPLESVCARGPAAAGITRDHPLAFSEGPGTPFGKLHERDSRILLLGVGFNRCTALHHAETLAARRRVTTNRFVGVESGRRVWIEAPNVADDNDTHFPIIGERYVAAGRARVGSIGAAPSVLVSMRDLVAFAVSYFDRAL